VGSEEDEEEEEEEEKEEEESCGWGLEQQKEGRLLHPNSMPSLPIAAEAAAVGYHFAASCSVSVSVACCQLQQFLMVRLRSQLKASQPCRTLLQLQAVGQTRRTVQRRFHLHFH
jgi:hypothetical protein